MFEIINRKGNITIRISSGDSAEIETEPFTDSDNNDRFDIDSNDKPIILGENDYVLFTVASSSGRIYLKKIITKDNYNEDNILTVKLYPEDTIDLQPYPYCFSFAYMPNKGEDCYTYATGVFEVVNSISTVRDLDVKSPIPDIPIEDTPTDGGDENDN